MHRTFRTPLLPALNGATRTRLYSSTTKTTQPATNTDHDAHHNPANKGSRLRLSSQASSINVQMRNELMKIQKQASANADLRYMQNLEEIHEMMSVYRRYRDSKSQDSTTKASNTTDAESIDETAAVKVNASDPIHSILTILRQRTKVLKPVISKVRKQIMGTQNQVLCQYLNEIADDLVAGRSYATRFALAYMITAFGTMENDVQASIVWKRLETESQAGLNQQLATQLADPRVVAAVIRSGDPQVVSIEELEEMHAKTTKANGHYMLLDESLAMCYIKFANYDKAVEMFAAICERYDLGEWLTSILRLYNQILTQSTDMKIATTFFETGVAADTFVQLHPSAVARYIEHLYDAEANPEAVVSVYERASQKIPTQTVSSYRFSIAQCSNMTAEALKALVQKHFATEGPTSEAKALIARIIAANPTQLCINMVMSYVSKGWEGSDYIAELQNQYFVGNKLDFDALRVVLSSCQSLNSKQVPLDRVENWWDQLLTVKRPQVFDWISLARACDNPDRVNYFIDKWISREPNSKMVIKFEFAPTVYAALVGRGLVMDPVASSENDRSSFANDVVSSEVSAREASTQI